MFVYQRIMGKSWNIMNLFFSASVYPRFHSRPKVRLIDGPLLFGTPAVRDAIPSDYVINIGRVLCIYIHGLRISTTCWGCHHYIALFPIYTYIYIYIIGCHFNSWNVWAGWESIDNLLSCGYGTAPHSIPGFTNTVSYSFHLMAINSRPPILR